MRMGATLLGGDSHNHASSNNGGNRVGYISSSRVIRKKRCIRKVKRRGPPIPTVLQELYEACRDIFKGPGTIPPPEDVQRLSRILGEFKL